MTLGALLVAEPIRFRSPALVVAVLGYIYDADEPVPWNEALAIFSGPAWSWKTVENTLYEIVAFGALHKAGRGATENRALKPTPLGRAWLDRELLALPTDPTDHEPIVEDPDPLLDAVLDLVDDDTLAALIETHTLEPGTET